MNTANLTTRPDPAARQPDTAVRSLPWSTRAVILVAFAIQFGSVGAGLAASAAAAPDCLRLCDGGLLPMLLADAVLSGAAVATTGPFEEERAGDIAAAVLVPVDAEWALPARAIGRVQLPIPPPVLA